MINITISTNPTPVIRKIECQENNSIWAECSNIAYSDYLTSVRVNCTDSDGIKNASLQLVNVPDNYEFFNGSASLVDGYGGYNNSDILIEDSGQFDLRAFCIDNLDGLSYIV